MLWFDLASWLPNRPSNLPSALLRIRAQADVCHAYQVFRQHQIPAEQIVTMMYDDLATSFFNTIKGQVFNEVLPLRHRFPLISLPFLLLFAPEPSEQQSGVPGSRVR